MNRGARRASATDNVSSDISNHTSHISHSSGFTLVELLVVIAIIGVLVALLLPAIQAAREAARRSHCTNNLKQIGLGLQNYHAQYKCFPPGARLHIEEDKVGLSWHVLLLPFVELGNIYNEIDPQPTGGANEVNGLAHKSTPVQLYHCPSADPPSTSATALHNAYYTGVSGTNTTDSAASGTNPYADIIDLEDVNCGDIDANGIFFPNSNTRIAQICDGTSNTLAIGERTYMFRHWLSGATWYGIPHTGRTPALSVFPPTAIICTGGANNIHYPINANHNEFGYYRFDFDPALPAGAQKTMRLNELPFASRHPGGAHFGYADGSVHFLNDEINFTTFQAMATKDGCEVVSDLP